MFKLLQNSLDIWDALPLVITQQEVVISYRRFGTTYRSSIRGSRFLSLSVAFLILLFLPSYVSSKQYSKISFLPSVLRTSECYEFSRTRDSKFWKPRWWRLKSEDTSLSRAYHRQICIYSVFTFYRWTTEEQRIVCLCISHNARSISEDERGHDNGDMRLLSLMSFKTPVSMTTPRMKQPNVRRAWDTFTRSMCLQCTRPCQEEPICQSSQPTIF
jgi:hypothetical protein